MPSVNEILLRAKETDAARWFPGDADTALESWVSDAAAEIQRRRGATTTKEHTYTMVADTQVYDLPDDCVKVIDLILQSEGLQGRAVFGADFPNEALPLGPFGCLPNGQSVTPSIDLIRRQRAGRDRREVYTTTRDNKIYFNFQVTADKTATLVYEAEDRDASQVPTRYVNLILTYVRYQSLGAWIDRSMTSGDFTGNTLIGRNIGEMRQWRETAKSEWEMGLRAIPREGPG